MTKKDYIAIAQQFTKTYAEAETQGELDAIAVLVSRIANVCEKDNPRFDREQFTAACREGR